MIKTSQLWLRKTYRTQLKIEMASGVSVTAGAATAVEAQEEEALMGRRRTKVMVAIDDSTESFYALRWAIDRLRPSIVGEDGGGGNDSGIVFLVHVQQPFQHFVYPAGPTGGAFYATSTMVESVRKAQEENSTLILSRALQMCREKMVKGEILILNGEPKDLICQAAEETHVDLLVLGSRGLGKIKRAFLGSVSDYCVHHAKCPILIVKPPKGDPTK